MPTVPIVETKFETRALPAVTSGARISAPQVGAPQMRAPQLSLPAMHYNTAGVEASNRLARTVADTTFDLAMESKKRADRIVLQEARRNLSTWEETAIFDPNNGALTKRGKDAFTLPDTVMADYDKNSQKIFDSLANDQQREVFSEMAYERRSTINRTIQRHTRTEMDNFEKTNAAAGIAAEQNRGILYGTQNPDVMENSIKTAQDIYYAYAKSKGAPDEVIRNQLQDIESKTVMGVLTSKAESSPKDAIEFYKAALPRLAADDLLKAQNLMKPVERKYKAQTVAAQALNTSTPKIARNDIIDYVMNDIEGGDKVVSDGGGVAKFGVNSKAHPNVDVPNLTPEEARSFYQQEYWDQIGADKMPADMRLVAFDTVVNHGLGKGKELIAEANGDARKLIELRQAEYTRLVKADPEKYGPNADGWMNRLAKVQSQVDMMRGKLPSALEVANRIDGMTDDPDVATDAKSLALKNLKAVEADRKASHLQANQEAFDYVRAGREVPASVEARMSSKDIAAMRRGAPLNPQIYESLRADILAGKEVQLADHIWSLGGKYDDLVKLQQDPNKQTNARKVDDVIKNSTRILLGRPTPKSPEDFENIENFRRSVDQEIKTIEASGKKASADEVEKITDRLLLKVDPEGWGSSKRMFEMKPGDKYEIDGVPSDRKLIIGGKEVDYQTVIKNVTSFLESKNVRVTQESIAETYAALVKKNLIVEQYQ